MAIYSTSIAELTRRVAAKTATPKKKAKAAAAAHEKEPEPAETPRERTNRLARERRARKKQEDLDHAAGVTLATGQVEMPVRDPKDTKHVSPKEKTVIPARRQSPASDAAAAPAAVHETNGHIAEEIENGTDEEDEETVDEDAPPPAALPAPPRQKKVKVHHSFPEEPPKWYSNLLKEVIKTKLHEAGEKASAKAIKETGDEMAKERWADPEEQAKMRASQDKLYSQIFRM